MKLWSSPSGSIVEIPIKTWASSVQLLTIAWTAIAMQGLSASWQPPQEPYSWSSIRRSLQNEGAIAKRPWIFFGSLENDTTQAAEYLSNLHGDQDVVVFDGLLLLRRSNDSVWKIQPLTMRAICAEGQLERQGRDGLWDDYPDRPNTASKVDWICQRSD